MNNKHAEIYEAAFRVIARYGVKKTTMGDIAIEAGISRQTLYNTFPGKDEVISGLVTHSMSSSLAEILKRWESLNTLEAKLDCYFELGPLYWYQGVQKMPEIADLFEGENSIAEETLNLVGQNWKDALTNLLRESGVKEDPDVLADFIYTTSKTLKCNADSIEHLQQRLNLLTRMTVALT